MKIISKRQINIKGNFSDDVPWLKLEGEHYKVTRAKIYEWLSNIPTSFQKHIDKMYILYSGKRDGNIIGSSGKWKNKKAKTTPILFSYYQSLRETQRTFYHEVSHMIWEKITQEEKQSFRNNIKILIMDGGFYYNLHQFILKNYGAENYDTEFFANFIADKWIEELI